MQHWSLLLTLIWKTTQLILGLLLEDNCCAQFSVWRFFFFSKPPNWSWVEGLDNIFLLRHTPCIMSSCAASHSINEYNTFLLKKIQLTAQQIVLIKGLIFFFVGLVTIMDCSLHVLDFRWTQMLVYISTNIEHTWM